MVGKEGENMYDVSLEHEDIGKLLECACRGIAACSTCHVYIDPNSFPKLNPIGIIVIIIIMIIIIIIIVIIIEQHELDMLELAWGYDPKVSLSSSMSILSL